MKVSKSFRILVLIVFNFYAVCTAPMQNIPSETDFQDLNNAIANPCGGSSPLQNAQSYDFTHGCGPTNEIRTNILNIISDVMRTIDSTEKTLVDHMWVSVFCSLKYAIYNIP